MNSHELSNEIINLITQGLSKMSQHNYHGALLIFQEALKLQPTSLLLIQYCAICKSYLIAGSDITRPLSETLNELKDVISDLERATELMRTLFGTLKYLQSKVNP